MLIHHIDVKGKVIDKETRCKHYHSERDRIAIKFKCCNTYYPCISCHEETVNHTLLKWKKHEWQQKAVLCGSCGKEQTIEEYLQKSDHCPNCKATYNPGCIQHHHYYFDINS